jgi:dihydropyrimidine dehydrogenase (NAD+) subunit PreA
MIGELKTVFLGKELINPFILASAPPTRDKESIIKGYKAGFAGAITKSVSESILQDKTPRIGHIKYKGKIIGSQNYEMGSIYGVEQWVKWADEIKQKYPDRLLGVSLFGSPNPDEWENLAYAFKDTSADLYELNFSCPHADYEGKGSVIGQNPDLCALLTKKVKDTVGNKKKIIVKHTYLSHPNEGYISKKCIESGADGFAGINTIAGLSPLDIYSFIPKLNTGGKTAHGGISGELIRPFARASIANIARNIDFKNYQISASGGVGLETESMAEYILLGATTLQVCTEVMNKGYNVVKNMQDNLAAYLRKIGANLDDIIGKSIGSVSNWFDIDEIARISSIDYGKCTACKTCIPFCSYEAININQGKLKIIEELCEGCGSCVSICPSDAMIMGLK